LRSQWGAGSSLGNLGNAHQSLSIREDSLIFIKTLHCHAVTEKRKQWELLNEKIAPCSQRGDDDCCWHFLDIMV
jgi:hypothetical protein